MKRNSWLAAILILVLSYGILVVPVAHDASMINVPVSWDPAIDFGRYYIVQHNALFDSSTLHAQSYISGLQTAGDEMIPASIFFAAIDIVGGSTSFPQDILSFVFIPIGYLLLIPISTLAVYEVCLKKSKRHFNSLDALILLLVSIFPIASLISTQIGNATGSILARGLFILIIALMLSVITDSGTRNGQTRKTKLALFFFLQIPFYMMYHTWAFYLLLVMLGFFAFSLVIREFELSRLSLFSLITYGAVAMFIYTKSLLSHPAHSIQSALAGETTLEHLTSYGSYSSLSNVFSYVQSINIALLLFIILIFCVYFMLIHLQKRKAATSELLILFLVCDVFVVAFALFTQGSIQLVLGRSMEFAFAVSFICAAFVLASNHKKYLSRSTEVAALIIAILCITSLLTAPSFKTLDLTQSEFAGITFAGTSAQNNTALFSDFRLATVLLYYNQTAIYSNAHLNNTSYEHVLQMYYSNTSLPEQAIDPVIKHEQSYLVITSTRETEVPLLDSGTVSLLPANTDFQSSFINDRQFDRVYDSALVSIFYRSR
jgi:hypothetical protein